MISSKTRNFRCCQEGLLAFPLDEVEDYLKFYEKQDIHPLAIVKRIGQLRPAYRIVKQSIGITLMFYHHDSLLQTQQTVIVAIDGNSGAGKYIG